MVWTRHRLPAPRTLPFLPSVLAAGRKASEVMNWSAEPYVAFETLYETKDAS